MLELRKKIKKKKPVFIRQDAHKKARLSKKWRRPKGLQSKMRIGFKGYRRSVEPGWGSPSSVKHVHSSGLIPVQVFSLVDLSDIDAKTSGVIIASAVGQKKRVAIIKEAEKLGLKIINIKDTSAFVKSVEEKLDKKKKDKEAKAKKKEAKAKEKKKKSEEKDGLSDKVAAEDKKVEEKKEKDKVLIQKV